ncbi:MAG: dihydroorotate dehydrogenase electron transfer subunit [Pirellulaceae bacterium]|nr:dihydroorotate dehydrogenase electron transfer subunit [Pirellulaceae bacterium]
MTVFADCASFLTAPILKHELIALDTWRIRIECPAIASSMVPGQFVMLRLDGLNDPLIGRALAMYDRIDDENGQPNAIDLVYVVKGKFTQTLSRCGTSGRVGIWGPLGNGFCNEPVDHLVMVAGGVGQTPMLTLGKEALGKDDFGKPIRQSGYAKQVTFCYGARSADRLAGVEDFQAAGFAVQLATDDGSLGGRQLLVTDLLRDVLGNHPKNQSLRIACCGPEPMMEAVSKIASEKNIRCEVSLETPMACGIGICFTCVAKVLQPSGDWDYQRTCVEGPVLDAATIVW